MFFSNHLCIIQHYCSKIMYKRWQIILYVCVDGKGSDGGISRIAKNDLWNNQKGDGSCKDWLCTVIVKWLRFVSFIFFFYKSFVYLLYTLLSMSSCGEIKGNQTQSNKLKPLKRSPYNTCFFSPKCHRIYAKIHIHISHTSQILLIKLQSLLELKQEPYHFKSAKHV